MKKNKSIDKKSQKKSSSKRLSAKVANKYLKDLNPGTKFELPSGTTGVLLSVVIGTCKVFVIDTPNTLSFVLEDGRKDPYWLGVQSWAPTTEVKEIK